MRAATIISYFSFFFLYRDTLFCCARYIKYQDLSDRWRTRRAISRWRSAVVDQRARECKTIKSTVGRRSRMRQGNRSAKYSAAWKAYESLTRIVQPVSMLVYLHCFNEYDENIKKYIYIYIICILLSFSWWSSRRTVPLLTRVSRMVLQSEKSHGRDRDPLRFFQKHAKFE